jgi:RNA polymerase sigma-70 factor (ECF subfamily)
MDRKAAFIEIVEKNKGLLFKAAGLYTDNLHDREDLLQEIIYQLWISFDSFNNQSAISTWILLSIF